MAQVSDIAGGYPRLATTMGFCPEMAVFKRFGDLSARNLLYLQAELLLLYEELVAIEKIDEKTQGTLYTTDFYELYKLQQGK